MLNRASCHEFAQRIKQMPEGFTAFKCDIAPALGIQNARFASTLDSSQLRAVAVAKAVEFMNPLFIEDPLPPPFSEAWMNLRRSTRIPLLTGEKLELVRGFRPFLDTQAVDIVHPDLAFAGETIESMAASNPPEVRGGQLKVPTGPGLGLDINPDFLRSNLVAGEEFWG